MAKITLAGESLIAQKQSSEQVLNVSRFIYANVPGLDPTVEVDRAAEKPPAAQIVYTHEIPAENVGFVNPNQVVYSSMLGSNIGDFDWNWLGLETEEGVLFAVAYVPLQQKRRNIPPLQIGNNTTRNILVEYDGAQALTAINIDASTWQHDFTVRLGGIDERERLSNRDVYGRACFFGTGLQVEKVDASYQIKPGLAYVEGVRVSVPAAQPVPGAALPTTVWLDVVLEQQQNNVVARWSLVCAAAKADYQDALGVQHYCIALADLAASGITDRRPIEAIEGPLVKHFATVKAVNEVKDRVEDLEDGTTAAGKARILETARSLKFTGAVTGQGVFNGSVDVTFNVQLSDFDWSKITTGKPTTLAGYGIIDAIKAGTYGLAGPVAPNSGAVIDNFDLPGGFHVVYDQVTAFPKYSCVLNMPYMSPGYGAQIAIPQGVGAVRVFARSARGANLWNDPVELYHTGNLDPSVIVPPGTVILFAGPTPPAGTLRMNGAAVSRTVYAKLFQAIGTRYGAGDGSTTFNLPEARGEFPRFLDDGRNVDPGRVLGSFQASQNLSHTHTASADSAGAHVHTVTGTAQSAGAHSHKIWQGRAKENTSTEGNGGDNAFFDGDSSTAGAHTHVVNGTAAAAGTHSHTITVAANGGNEARPRNVAYLACIAY